jgi:serine/threonine protein kinase
MSPDRWREIEALFDAAHDCPPERLAQLLAQAEPDVRREVESLLAQRSREGPLDGFAVDLLESAGSETPGPGFTAPVMRLEPGMSLGPYTVVSRLGSGGMGVVYEAEDTRLGRRVALKVLHDRVACDPGALERFRREARNASALNHPNICTIYDVGDHEGCPFIVMERVEGRTLSELEGRRPLPIATILRVAIQIVDALEALHAKGIVHRDLKSTNVLVTDKGQVKVMDFGVAKLSRPDTQASGSDNMPGIPQESLTGTGIPIGTVLCMSPSKRAARIPTAARTCSRWVSSSTR